jgi:hypothetical protein
MTVLPKLSIRRLPYPFRAALAISNDADFCQMAFFEELMRFLNTRRNTAFGTGLGLEVTSSYFAFSQPERQFSYFCGIDPDAPLSEHASRVEDYLVSGWIDANHAYGDFDGIGGFTRKHAMRVFESLAQLGVRLDIFINHGDAHNSQCLGEEAPHHKGDAPGNPAYHTDLLAAHGTRYITSSRYIFGDAAFDGHAPSLAIPARGRWRWRRPQAATRQDLFSTAQLRDGSRFEAFFRLRGTGFNAPNLSSLAYQLQRAELEELYRSGGIVVLYQHLGVLTRIAGKCVPACVETVRQMPHLLAPLRVLAREAEEGRLWVAGLQRLLQYADMVRRVKVAARGDADFLLDIDCKVDEPTTLFGGLTLYCHPASMPKIRYKNVELPFHLNGPDETGQYSVTVRMRRLPDIW